MANYGHDGHGVSDAILLSEVTEDAFVDNLKLRFSNEEIYTYIGEVLISVNPYQNLPIYGDDALKRFRGKAIYEDKPHVFALAEAAYSDLRRSGHDVVVVISGESGAGKTEASKRVMQYVAAASTAKHAQEINRVKDMLLASNPLLEAFGNAQTIRNDNSSRFGKYMDINFDFSYAPLGGHIKNYLLEKARVIRQAPGERNFHVFYQLLQGASDQQLASLHLERDAQAYPYLKESAGARSDDAAAYKATLNAMSSVGLAKDVQDTLHKIVATVLNLGKVDLTQKGEGSQVADSNLVSRVASLLDCQADNLAKALTSRLVAARGEVFEKPLNQEEAAYARDALAKAVYDRLFSFLVTSINDAIAVKDKSRKNAVMGVLDIYGFEIFPSNGFEQFCINYCNEKLQQLFIELVMRQEQDEYEREGITWVNIDFFDNEAICDLVENPKHGIFAILDEQCARPNGADSAFLAHMDTAFAAQPRYCSRQTDDTDRECVRKRDFRIKHYAGDVVYNSEGFVEKNTDILTQDIKRVLYSSNNPLIQSMWAEGADDITAVHKMPPTAAATFKHSMAELVRLLLLKSPFYIRCIKPNGDKASKKWDDELVRHQVRYIGLMENLRVRRAGYCNRQTYETFLARYKMLSKETWPSWHKSPIDGVKTILDQYDMHKEVAYGKTKIFIKEPSTIFKLEAERQKTIPLLVAKIQAQWRGYMARRHVRRLRAVLVIARAWKTRFARTYIVALNKAFQDCGKDSRSAKSMVWPEHHHSLAKFAGYCHKILDAWAAKKLMAQYSKEELAVIQLKIRAMELLRGQRPDWGYHLQWKGNYIAKSTQHAAKFAKEMSTLMTKYGDAEILFSSFVTKLNTKGKEDERAVVLTDKHLYRLDGKSFKLCKTPISCSSIQGVALSNGQDKAIVIQVGSDSDVVVVLHGDVCAAELLSMLSKATSASLDVTIREKLHYKAKGQTKSLAFQTEEAPTTKFTRRASGYTLVTRKDSLNRIQAPRGAFSPLQEVSE